MTEQLGNYLTLTEAAQREGVPYSTYWLRKLCKEGKIKCLKIGTERRGQWMIYWPSLQAYCQTMNDLGTRKHGPSE
jgi:predicted site-specific integrase-resolvase